MDRITGDLRASLPTPFIGNISVGGTSVSVPHGQSSVDFRFCVVTKLEDRRPWCPGFASRRRRCPDLRDVWTKDGRSPLTWILRKS